MEDYCCAECLSFERFCVELREYTGISLTPASIHAIFLYIAKLVFSSSFAFVSCMYLVWVSYEPQIVSRGDFQKSLHVQEEAVAWQHAEEGKNYSNNEDFNFTLDSVAHQSRKSNHAQSKSIL